MANNVLEVKGLSVAYGKVEAVSKISLSVGEGKIVTVIGPNGAGKTTTLSAIMGLLPSSGQVTFDGSIEQVPEVERMVVRGMNLVPEKRELFGSMSIEDNLLLGAFQRSRQGHRDHRETMEDVFALFPRLKERRQQAAGTMSGGERQMLAVGRALMAKPSMILLDEPSMGLAPQIVEEIFEIVKDLNQKERVSFLLAEQNTMVALRYANFGYILENGRIVMDGTAQDLSTNEDVKEFYLGLGGEGRKSFREVKHYRRRKRWLA